MYPRNAASPERLLIGQVILIADGTVQSSAVVITVRGQGGAEATGGNSAVFGADNSVYYTPTQAETNFTSFTVIASKASCLSAGLTVVTTASSTAGQVDVKSVAGTAQTANDNGLDINALITTIGAAGAGLTGIAAVGDVTNLSNLPTIPTNWITADGIAADAIGSSELADSAVTEIQTGLATSAELAVVDGIVDTILIDTADIQANYATATALATVDTNVDQILVDTGTTIPATIATVDGIVDTILVDTGTTIPATLTTIDGIIDSILGDTSTDGVVLSVATANQVADALLKRDWTSVAGEADRSALNALRFLRNKWSIAGATLTVTEEDDSTSAWTATVTTDAGADPVTGNDPA